MVPSPSLAIWDREVAYRSATIITSPLTPGQSGRLKGVEEVNRLVVELSDLQRAFHVFGCQFLCRQLVKSTTCRDIVET